MEIRMLQQQPKKKNPYFYHENFRLNSQYMDMYLTEYQDSKKRIFQSLNKIPQKFRAENLTLFEGMKGIEAKQRDGMKRIILIPPYIYRTKLLNNKFS